MGPLTWLPESVLGRGRHASAKHANLGEQTKSYFEVDGEAIHSD